MSITYQLVLIEPGVRVIRVLSNILIEIRDNALVYYGICCISHC